MQILVLCASNRPGERESRKISDRIAEKLTQLDQQPDLLDLQEVKLPLFDNTDSSEWQAIKERVAAADGFVWVVPEWNGMAPPSIINFLSYANGRELAHKPVLIMTVSSGTGGAYPLAELKAFGGKNRHYVLVPEHIVFRKVSDLFNAAQPNETNEFDQILHKRTDFALRTLLQYADKLTDIRQALGSELDNFHFGM